MSNTNATAPIVTAPTTDAYFVVSSHRTEAAAVKAARKRGAIFVLHQPACSMFGAVWHVCAAREVAS